VKRGFGLTLGMIPLSLAAGFCAGGLVTLALLVFAPQIFTGFQPVSAASQDSLAGEAVCFLVLGLIFSLIAGRALWKFMRTDGPAKPKSGGWWPGKKN